jgi:uncharacterized protein YjiS (DUF1127 family)
LENNAMLTLSFPSASTSAHAAVLALTKAASRGINTLSRRHAHRKALKELGALEDRMLHDIGLSRSEITSVTGCFGIDLTRRPR